MNAVIPSVVIIGAGHAGVECAAQLRDKGFQGRLQIVSNEPGTPYQRPPLSKDYLKRPGSALPLRPQSYLDVQRIEITNATATRIDRAGRLIHLDGGITPLRYDRLVLATGARNRRIDFPGTGDYRPIELRTLADAERIAAVYANWKSVLVIGGGFIGLEMAGLLSQLEKTVIVVEAADRLMRRAVTTTTSEWFQEHHRRSGTEIILGRHVASISGNGKGGARVILSDGADYEVDAVLLAAGVLPNIDLAQEAGLETKDGVVVDSQLRTSDPSIYAIGDCARFPASGALATLRLESVQNANDQARSVAAHILGKAADYCDLPWFWSVQGSARLQIAGLADPGSEELVRGSLDGGKFSVLLFNKNKLVSVESVNAPGDHVVARKLLSSPNVVTKEDIAAAPELKALLAR